MVPLLLYVPGLTEKAFQHQKDLMTYIDELLSAHIETREPSYTRDITDAFLEEMEKVRSGHSQGLGYDTLVMKFHLLACHAQQLAEGLLCYIGELKYTMNASLGVGWGISGDKVAPKVSGIEITVLWNSLTFPPYQNDHRWNTASL